MASVVRTRIMTEFIGTSAPKIFMSVSPKIQTSARKGTSVKA